MQEQNMRVLRNKIENGYPMLPSSNHQVPGPGSGIVRFQSHNHNDIRGNYNCPRPSYWPPPRHNHGTPYDRFERTRPWINSPYPRFTEPQAWIRPPVPPRQPYYQHYGNATVYSPRILPPESPPFRYCEPMSRSFYDPCRTRSCTLQDTTSAVLSRPTSCYSHNRNSDTNHSPKWTTLKANEEDEEYCPEPIRGAFVGFNRGFRNGDVTDSDDTADRSDSSGGSNISTEDNGSYSNENFSNEHLCPSPSPLSPLLEKSHRLSDIRYPETEECHFVEIFLAASVKLVRNDQGRAEPMATFGVWLDKKNKLNFAEALPKNRIQCLKAVLIHGSGKAIKLMKEQGFNRIKITMESDFIINNVAVWIGKFINDSCRGVEPSNCSNWDEYKYAIEIDQLCRAFQGMVVKWSHAPCHLEGIRAAKILAREILSSKSPGSLWMISQK